MGLAHKRVPRNGPPLRRRLHRHERTGSCNPPETNHHPHQGRQPCFYNAHQRNAHRVEAEVVAAQGQHHRVQPMGPQTNGAREQEAVDLLYYLWKAYKAAHDDEFVIYIKELKSQADDGRATYTAEDLMVRAENKYKARLLDEDNTWGKPTDEQEKIVAMMAEINSLKKERRGVTDKANKSATKEKKPAAKKTKEQKKTKETAKKKSQDKWAWKNKPSKENDRKEDNAFVKTFEGKKYFWCSNHNHGADMWTLHHPKDCEAGKAQTDTATKAHIATFDTVDSDSDME